MGRMNFGGQQDLSGVFASLVDRYQANVEADVASARSQAEQDQAAEDQEIYAKWKAGKISDKVWLKHLRDRVGASLEPEERARYSELLLEHEGAIADAQVEAKYAMGQIGAGAVMSHYRRRMGQVEQNSPAWRELATRYGQFANAGYSGGGGGGGGGGSRRSGGGGSGGGGAVPSASDVEAMFEGVLGFDTSGEDVIDPTLSLTGGYEDSDDYLEQLKSDIRRIESIHTQIESGATRVVDVTTGEWFDVTPEFTAGISNQYIRTEQQIAATLWAEGDEDGASMALDYAVKWATGPMQEWQSAGTQDALREIEQLVFSRMVADSVAGDPRARQATYRQLLKEVDTWIEKNLPEDATLGGRADQASYDRASIIRDTLDLGANWDQYTAEERDAIANRVLSLSYSMGEGGASVPVRTLLDGSGEGTENVPAGFIGVLENADQIMGLANGDAMMRGAELPFPEFQGDPMVFAYDGKVTRVVSADVKDKIMADGSTRPTLVPAGAEENVDVVMARVKVRGKDQTVWVEPRPADDPRFRVYRANQSIGDYRAGDLIPSDAIAEWGKPRLNALVAEGAVAAESTVQAIELPGGVTWFRDTGTGAWSLTPPVVPGELDPVTGGVRVDSEGEPEVNPIPFNAQVPVPFAGISAGGMQVWLQQAAASGVISPSEYLQRGPGGELIPVASFENMYVPKGYAVGRGRNQSLAQTLRDRQVESESEWIKSAKVQRNINRDVEAPDPVERIRRNATRLGVDLGQGVPMTGRNTAPAPAREGDPKEMVRFGDFSVKREALGPWANMLPQKAKADVEEAWANRGQATPPRFLGPVDPKIGAPEMEPVKRTAPVPIAPTAQPAPQPTYQTVTAKRTTSKKTQRQAYDARQNSDSGGFI